MRYSVWLALLLAGSGDAQWRHFGGDAIPPTRSPPRWPRSLVIFSPLTTWCGACRNAPLAWSERLAARAQDWADTLAGPQAVRPPPESDFRENLFEIVGASASASQVVNSWASESHDYELQLEHVPRHVRALHADRVAVDERSRLRGGRAGDGREVWVLQLRSAGKLDRQAAVLSRSSPGATSPSPARRDFRRFSRIAPASAFASSDPPTSCWAFFCFCLTFCSMT